MMRAENRLFIKKTTATQPRGGTTTLSHAPYSGYHLIFEQNATRHSLTDRPMLNGWCHAVKPGCGVMNPSTRHCSNTDAAGVHT